MQYFISLVPSLDALSAVGRRKIGNSLNGEEDVTGKSRDQGPLNILTDCPESFPWSVISSTMNFQHHGVPSVLAS